MTELTDLKKLGFYTSDSISKIAPALVAAWGETGSAKKRAENPHFRSAYADLEDILEAVQPILSKNKIAVVQGPAWKDSHWVCVTVLLHDSSEFIACDTPILTLKGDPQSFGSGLTYAKRYGLQAMAGIASEDDDGEKAMDRADGTVRLVEQQNVNSQLDIPDGFEVVDSDPGSYVVQIGKKYKGKRLSEIPRDDIADFILWLGNQAHITGKPLSGKAFEFVERATVYLDSLP
jgi:hypothetical protein